ncbi:MAG: hypothetical protein DWQ02_21140 [Bacteroidetes bacterium]|nr:MAG: hypothetical protein DWQ02_21140 [Bacteroidota bacterium]
MNPVEHFIIQFLDRVAVWVFRILNSGIITRELIFGVSLFDLLVIWVMIKIIQRFYKRSKKKGGFF